MAKGEAQIPTTAQFDYLEANYPEGFTTGQILGFLAEREILISATTLYKYIRFGLLPQSRRIGRGRGGDRCRGSQGIFPPWILRLLFLVRELLKTRTIEEIAPRMQHLVELYGLRDRFSHILAGMEEDLKAPHLSAAIRAQCARELREIQKDVDALLRDLDRLGREAFTDAA